MGVLDGTTIATVGSGVMAEAMIAGLLRGELVTPDQIVASHPRPERRDQLQAEYGVRVAADNVAAIAGADARRLAGAATAPDPLAAVNAAFAGLSIPVAWAAWRAARRSRP